MLRRSPRRGAPEEDQLDGIQYDNLGRMKYHPDFHPNHGKPFTTDELIYICKYHDVDDPRTLSFAIGKTEHTIASKITRLRHDGKYDMYRNFPDEKWERILNS